MTKDMQEVVLDEFVLMHPHIEKDIVDWYPSGQLEVTVRLRDGSKYSYDYLGKICRRVCNSDYRENRLKSEEEIADEFSYRLYKKMRHRNVTQRELSDITGISVPAIGSYIRGEKMPSLYNVYLLSRALACSISELADFNTMMIREEE